MKSSIKLLVLTTKKLDNNFRKLLPSVQGLCSIAHLVGADHIQDLRPHFYSLDYFSGDLIYPIPGSEVDFFTAPAWEGERGSLRMTLAVPVIERLGLMTFRINAEHHRYHEKWISLMPDHGFQPRAHLNIREEGWTGRAMIEASMRCSFGQIIKIP